MGKVTVEETLIAAITLLSKLDVLTVEELEQSVKGSYDGIYDLLNEKYKILVENGTIHID